MNTWQQEYYEKYYKLRGYVDSTTTFYSLIDKFVNKNSRVLEIGPGRTNKRTNYLASLCGYLVGLDIDAVAKENRDLAESHLYNGDEFPLPDSSFDAVVSIWVNEHINNPEIHAKEISRILRPGGRLIFNTPNKYHYATLIAAASPHWFHVLVANRSRNLGSSAVDPHPTFYRFNTRRKIRSVLEQQGMEIETLVVIEGSPIYFQFSKILYIAGVAYERMLNSTHLLEDLRQCILCIAKKV